MTRCNVDATDEDVARLRERFLQWRKRFFPRARRTIVWTHAMDRQACKLLAGCRETFSAKKLEKIEMVMAAELYRLAERKRPPPRDLRFCYKHFFGDVR